jgi:hypothetical protein
MQLFESTHEPDGPLPMTQGPMRLRVDQVAWRDVGDELIVLELATSTYLTLNGSAKQLWLGLVSGATAEELVGSLVAAYGISVDQAGADTESFLAALLERKLIEPDD